MYTTCSAKIRASDKDLPVGNCTTIVSNYPLSFELQAGNKNPS